MTEYQYAFSKGLERAALHLQRKADKLRKPVEEFGSETANMMALIYETEANEILALRTQL